MQIGWVLALLFRPAV